MKHNVDHASEVSDNGSSDDDVGGIRFDDNEEEKIDEINEVFVKFVANRPIYSTTV